MKHYRGRNDDDVKWLEEKNEVYQRFEEGNGCELYNFKSFAGTVYGSVAHLDCSNNQRGVYKKIHVDIHFKEYFSANKIIKNDDNVCIEGMTVIFTANNPETHKRVVVGWYDNATVYKVTKTHPIDRHIAYYAKTKKSNAHCIREDCRSCIIDTREFKQTMIWYAQSEFGKEIQDKVRKYIEDINNPQFLDPPEIECENEDDVNERDKSNSGFGAGDPETKKIIETIAVNVTKRYYNKKGYKLVRDVQCDNVGWDLTYSGKDGEEFYVEVKGTASESVNLLLTPNEYEQLKLKYEDYKIASVTNCKDNNGTLNIFSIEKRDRLQWKSYLFWRKRK
jgi:hypothetical protein